MASARVLIRGRSARECGKIAFSLGCSFDALIAGPRGTSHAVHDVCAAAPVLGNTTAVRVRELDDSPSHSVSQVPPFEGPFQQSIVFTNDEKDADDNNVNYTSTAELLHVALLTQPGGIVHWFSPSASLDLLHSQFPIPLQQCTHPAECYVSPAEHDMSICLQVPDGYQAGWLPLCMSGLIETGAGRGSASLGFPTANVGCDPGDIARGVYVCWAYLHGEREPEGAVANVGERPSVNDCRTVTVEVHLFGDHCNRDLRGSKLDVVLCGWMRPEIQFRGLDHLAERISADVNLAKIALASSDYLRSLKP